jgi:hypothetical protein
VKGGQALGATDEFGVQAAEMRVDAHDLNATLLRLMGMDHEKLSYFYRGRDQRLTDVHGQNEFTSALWGRLKRHRTSLLPGSWTGQV